VSWTMRRQCSSIHFDRLRTLVKNSIQFDVCLTAHHWYNNIDNQLAATIMVY
jgi:hypothetical protein